MLLAMVRDLRVILVKLADRTHNLRTIDSLAPAKRRLQSHSAFLPQLLAQMPQPELGIAQPVQQRHIGDICNAR